MARITPVPVVTIQLRLEARVSLQLQRSNPV